MSNTHHYPINDAIAKPIWHITNVSDDDVARVSSATNLPPLVVRVLCARGMSDAHQIDRFMRPSSAHLHDPFSMADMDTAAKRIVRALRTRECILVHGDFDVDGVCGTALLATKLSQWGGRVFWFIPDRFVDGYGVSMRAINAATNVGAKLILTVDCGISAMEEIATARKHNMDVIVIDHHEPSSKLPPAHAVLDPKRCDCGYPFKELSGTGVALKLLCAVATHGGYDDPLEDPMCLDLTALATVADVVPLLDENRVLVKFGLEALSARHRIGVRALTHCAGLRRSDITSTHVAFILGPRLNAAGRLEHARTALRLLLTQDEMEAMELARHLNTLNRDRQAEEERTFQQAIE
ncbi:MAG TPA: single-stranded-DNA-specific exonuclease RecJ, partial [Armatimonadetes bacterium]|nr:single-stranded-DNA-specific exonuclease RecJ [Armatimonadota bacterium]